MKIDKNIDLVDDSFWKQENDRLIAKFEPIYIKMGKDSVESLKSVNVLNKRLVDKQIEEIKEKDVLMDKIREIYGSFDKQIGKMKDSRVNLISNEETRKI